MPPTGVTLYVSAHPSAVPCSGLEGWALGLSAVEVLRMAGPSSPVLEVSLPDDGHDDEVEIKDTVAALLQHKRECACVSCWIAWE